MKRVLTFLAIMLLPLSVWAMTPVTDSDLADVTGQAGVSINADLTMDISIGTMAWGDDDGIGTSCENPWTSTYGVGGGGYIGVSNFAINNLNIRARTDSADAYNGYTTVFLKPITIDVATAEKNGVADVTFVRFGLGALNISLDSMTFDVGLATASDFNSSYVLDQTMGRVTLAAMDIYINPWSYVDIYAHDGCGVNFDMAITIDHFAMDYASWGDLDGLPGGNVDGLGVAWMTNAGAGYVGMDNFVMGDGVHAAIVIDGGVAIDIATAAHGVYADLNFLFEQMRLAGAPAHGQSVTLGAAAVAYLTGLGYTEYAVGDVVSGEIAVLAWMVDEGHDYALQNVGASLYDIIENSLVPGAYAGVPAVTAVHISFPKDFSMEVAQMTGDVVLGSTADFAGADTHDRLGNFYIGGFDLTIDQGSWVDIWAH